MSVNHFPMCFELTKGGDVKNLYIKNDVIIRNNYAKFKGYINVIKHKVAVH